jgi:hypothetical protein
VERSLHARRLLRHPVDRLIHRAEVIDIEADSHRLKEAKELTAARTKRRSENPTT